MQKSCRVGFMYGELTDATTIDQIDLTLEQHQTDQFEILLYKKNRKTIEKAIHMFWRITLALMG